MRIRESLYIVLACFSVAAVFALFAAMIAWAIPGPGGYPAWRVGVEAGGILGIAAVVVSVLVIAERLSKQ